MKCPKCRHEFDYREVEMEEEWRKIIQLLPAFDGQGRLVMEYVELFEVTPLRLKAKKLLRLLEEVGALFSQKRFKWKKATYEISEKGIIEGLKVTCNANLTTPIKDHNYLRAVLASISQEEKKEWRSAADKDLRQFESSKLKGQRSSRTEVEEPQCDAKTRRLNDSMTEGDILSPEDNRRRAAELANRVGRKI